MYRADRGWTDSPLREYHARRTGLAMLADRLRDRRMFLCGDAAHIWAPFAG